MNTSAAAFVLIGALACACPAALAPQTPARNLFNGTDLTGWHADVPAADTNPNIPKSFVVRNGLLVSLGDPRGHLITDSVYHDYRLEIEYRFPGKPGNAGVLVHASTPRALYKMFPRSIEVQMEHGNAGDFWCIVEDIRVPDMERRRGPAAQWGGTEDKARRIVNLTDNSEKALGEWNTMVIEAVGRALRVWVNGDLVNAGSDATTDRGQIALQAEGSEVEFRKLELTPIASLSAAQPDTTVVRAQMRRGAELDRAGATGQAREVFQALIDSAPDPATKAAAQRAMAMSYAFDGDCANTLKYEELVIAYWATRERAEPQNAFYQQGEMANEGARVCLEAGDLGAAERWYRRGYELGVKEPAPVTHPRSLWDYRLAHALGRIAARRGKPDEAQRQIAVARRALDSDTAMARQQGRFFPYLVGYVALYTGDLATAEAQLRKGIALRGNEQDPFQHCLLAMTLERAGRRDEAKSLYQQAYDLATGHNPPAAFVRPFARKKR